MGDFIGDCKNHSTTCIETYLIYNIIFADPKKKTLIIQQWGKDKKKYEKQKIKREAKQGSKIQQSWLFIRVS